MDYRQDMNEIVANCVEDAVWKTRKQGATNTRDYFSIEERSLLKTSKLQFNRSQELFAQSRALRFIPLARLAYFKGSSRKL